MYKNMIEQASQKWQEGDIECKIYIASNDKNQHCITGGYSMDDKFIEVDCIAILQRPSMTTKQVDKEVSDGVSIIRKQVSEEVTGIHSEPRFGIERAVYFFDNKIS